VTPAASDSPVLVTGGTGTLGTFVVERLRNVDRQVRVLSRDPHEGRDGLEFVTGDLATGDGIDAAVNGAEVIVHCAGSNKGDDEKARRLVEAAGGAQHLVYISVVGADAIPVRSRVDRAMFGYFACKLAAEEIVAESGIPFTILRSTQFHEFIWMTAKQMAKMPVMPVPSGFRFQPVDAGEVADRLVDLAMRAPAGRVADIAGAEVFEMPALVRDYLHATGKHRLIVPMRLPGKAAAAYRQGANLAPDRAVGRRTWQEFLADRWGGSGAMAAPAE
jgi:uncharacterized protein YbjT (DUF2867 family)